MTSRPLVYTTEGEWFWQQPHNTNPSASSKRRQSNPKRRKRMVRQVLERDGHICTYCGDPATTADHIIPLGKGGEDTLENQTAACEPCNLALGWLGL